MGTSEGTWWKWHPEMANLKERANVQHRSLRSSYKLFSLLFLFQTMTIFLGKTKYYGMNYRCLIYSSILSTGLSEQRINIDPWHKKGQRDGPKFCVWPKTEERMPNRNAFNRIFANILC